MLINQSLQFDALELCWFALMLLCYFIATITSLFGLQLSAFWKRALHFLFNFFLVAHNVVCSIVSKNILIELRAIQNLSLLYSKLRFWMAL